jgi:hypothetical protein
MTGCGCGPGGASEQRTPARTMTPSTTSTTTSAGDVMTSAQLQSTGCVSLSTGTISPDERVNYEYGMVLGVDDFRTEQQHGLELDYRHERALHGFGTVYGLQVTLGAADGGDAQVTVEPGMLIDQFGREAVLPVPQCARVGAWLAAQEQLSPGAVASHLGPSGEMSLYVVARYTSCLDALVPLPGTPCSTSSTNAVPSRIRDAWQVDLRFTPPPMPRWDTDRRLARLLGAVRIVTGLPHNQSDEQLIIDAMLDLPAQVADGPDVLQPPSSPPGGAYQLPADSASDALDRIFTVWVTRVRPLFGPDLTDPATDAATTSDPAGAGEQAILLSTLHVQPANPFEVAEPVISSYDVPDDEGRPYLLHTGLIQELRSLDESEAVDVRPVEFAVLSPAVHPSGLLILDAWFPLGHDVGLPDTVAVTTETGTVHTFRASATDVDGNSVDFAQRWSLTAPEEFTARDGQQLRVVFDGSETMVDDPATTLKDAQERTGLTLLNSGQDGSVAAYATVQIDPVVEQPQPPQPPKASVEFLTVTTSTIENKQLRFELWFHPEPRGSTDDVLLAERPEVGFFDEITGNPLNVVSFDPHPVYRNVWEVVTELPDDQLPLPAYARLITDTEKTIVNVRGAETMSLLEWIEKDEILFIGWDPEPRNIVAFARVGANGGFQ